MVEQKATTGAGDSASNGSSTGATGVKTSSVLHSLYKGTVKGDMPLMSARELVCACAGVSELHKLDGAIACAGKSNENCTHVDSPNEKCTLGASIRATVSPLVRHSYTLADGNYVASGQYSRKASNDDDVHTVTVDGDEYVVVRHFYPSDDQHAYLGYAFALRKPNEVEIDFDMGYNSTKGLHKLDK